MKHKWKCDLHTHTYYSDGLLAPEVLVRAASERGVEVLAITDHETTRGSREAQSLARELEVDLIPAVEMASRWDGYGWAKWGYAVDVLGYFINWDVPQYRALETAMLVEYNSQLGETCEVATSLGYPVTYEEAFTENPTYPSLFSMLEVLRKKGLVMQGHEERVFEILVRCWGRVCQLKFPIDVVIEAIHAAGGVAVIAHPSVVLRSDGGLLREEDLAQLVEMGLDGLEVYHFRLPDETTRLHFLALARTFDLAVSGGSDEHGRPNGITRLGQEPVTMEMIDALRARRRHQRENTP